jgi:uncharacterized protein YndB with AHSA1/START domain
MTEYAFLTTWLLESPRQPIWDAIYDQASWPSWWRGVEEAEELTPGDGNGVGSVSRLVWKSLLPYRVEFGVTSTRVERYNLMEGHAVGELEGSAAGASTSRTGSPRSSTSGTSRRRSRG